MTGKALGLLAPLALSLSLALFPLSVGAGQSAPDSGAPQVSTASPANVSPTAGAHGAGHRFEQDELDELAALEAENTELQEQTAGFFGPRVGTVIIIAILLVVLL